jgi:hypothetical protein
MSVAQELHGQKSTQEVPETIRLKVGLKYHSVEDIRVDTYFPAEADHPAALAFSEELLGIALTALDHGRLWRRNCS